MTTPDDAWQKLTELAATLSENAGFPGALTLEPLTADGSTRRFCRLRFVDGKSAVLIAPGSDHEAARREARASWLIGCHLAACDAPVPHQYAFDAASGALLCEDLGGVHLFTLAARLNRREPRGREQLRDLYQETIRALVAMQVRAADGFDPAWCCDTPKYDKNMMLTRESGYFLRAFWQDFLDQAEPAGLAAEFRLLAELAAQPLPVFFLHRDVQSRNIMIHAGRPRFIDYQGGRLGPLGYDLASLLIDPYVQLDESMREDLLLFYLERLRRLIPVDEEEFRRGYLALAAQRNLQILGAFAFLSQKRGKPFFAAYLRPALTSLNRLLADETLAFLPTLTECARRAENLLMLRQNEAAQ
ncbi:MAG: phosphotransferase [Desulfobulbaceae bacterium]|jgi:aminoglycoside/choline kinase family phosphotransferase|nr:phosphotransferase [Desulfobulbaceae bacterium]